MEDTGVGIDLDKMKTIQRCLKSKDVLEVCANLNKTHGCGLGLIISHCLALLLGPPDSNGLQVNSEAHNGSEFSFYLEAFQEKEDDSESLSMVEEKSRDFSKSSFNSKHLSSVGKISSKYNNSLGSVSKVPSSKNSKTSKSRNSIMDFRSMRKDRKETLCNFNMNEEVVDSGAVSKDKTACCGSERTTIEIINFLQNHTLQPKKMMEMTGNYSEILIVDDDSFNLLALESILSKFNLKSVRAFNGQQAVEKIREKHKNFPQNKAFSIVFLDYHLPIKNGIETTQEIHKMFKSEGLIEFPIIACTAFGAKDLVEQWSQAGMSDFIVKPVSFQKIEGILRKFEVMKL